MNTKQSPNVTPSLFSVTASCPPAPNPQSSDPPEPHVEVGIPEIPKAVVPADLATHTLEIDSPSEQDHIDLDICENGIKLHWHTFVKVGQALAKVGDEHEQREWEAFVEVGNLLSQIRDRRLYRGQFPTFGAYCAAKWPFKRAHAHRLILGAQIFKCLSPIGDIQPHRESQARPLYASDLSEDQKRAAWCRAIQLAGGQEPTAKQVKAAVAEIKSPVSGPKEHLRRKKLPLAAQTIKLSIFKLLDKAEMCIDSGQPDLAAKLVREAKEKLDKL